ncbi:MAG TPA: alpha-mannosidase [Candidatus Anaerobutyricum faecale]|nr:alpha-mannosidase [Candidatus Anaerobutyricum faecale]
MFFTVEKFQRRVEELGRRRYFGMRCIAPFAAVPGTLGEDEHYHGAPPEIISAIQEPPVTEFGLHDFFVGRDRYLWMEKELVLPPAKEGCQVVGLFDFGETGDGNNSGFESLLYLDGHPYQGVDTNHKEVLFTGKEGEKTKITFLLWTGLEGGGPHRTFYHQCRQADVGYLHNNTDEMYHLAKAVTETLRILPEDDVNYAGLTAALDRALLCIDWDEEAAGSGNVAWRQKTVSENGIIPREDIAGNEAMADRRNMEQASSFYTSVDRAYQVLMDGLSRMEKHTNVTVHAVGHTHIDVAWLWRLKHTREKAQRSFATVLRLMEEDEDYIFLQTQPQLYQYVKEDCPELYERIRQKVKEGKWEPDGGMWVEADCNIPSGESLVRQFLHGTRFFEREFGKKCEYLWLPDVFGYSWALPQILKLCEIDTFMTTKISWNQFNSIPNDLFCWRGIDGTEILTYFVNTPDEGREMTDRFSTYNGYMNPRSVLGSWKKFRNKDISRDTLISYGYGDGGGGVNREMLAMRRAMDVVPGLPNVKSGTAGAFFRKMHENVENTDRYVHTWDGELYLEYHRGTYTSQAYNKKTNRRMENKLLRAEWLSSLAWCLNGDYPKEALHESWECVLLHQFHDIIPGSSIHEVYEDSKINYGKAERRVDAVLENVLEQLTEQNENSNMLPTGQSEDQVRQPLQRSVGSGTVPAGQSRNPAVRLTDGRQSLNFSVCSACSFGGRELVTVPVTEPGHFYDAEGNELEADRTAEGCELLVDVEPFAVKHVTFVPEEDFVPEGTFVPEESSSSTEKILAGMGNMPDAIYTANQRNTSLKTDAKKAAASQETFLYKDNTLETPFYFLSWNGEGQLTQLYDKSAGCPVLKEGQKGNVLEVYEDKPMDFDAWDIDIYYTQKMETMGICEPVRLVEQNAFKVVLRFVYGYRRSRLAQDMILYRDSKRIDFKTRVDWQENHRLLKTAFYTDIRTTKATYDTQFGHVERPTHWNTSWDWARFEVCGHKWADLSETGYGVSLLNDCKYGYSIKDNAMKLSLLKSAKNPDTEADMGEHTFTYALYPHEGAVTEGGTIEEACRLNLPAQVVPGRFKDLRRLVKISGRQEFAAGPDCVTGSINERPDCGAGNRDAGLDREKDPERAASAVRSVQIDAVKKAEDEDCLIVRMHECRGGRATVVVSSEFPVERIMPCNLLERSLVSQEKSSVKSSTGAESSGNGEDGRAAGRAENGAVNGSEMVLTFHPFEIKTFKFYL